MRFKVPQRQPASFRGAALYLAGQIKGLSPDRVEFVERRNLFTDDPRTAAAIMDATAEKSVRCQQPAYHFMITFDPKDAAAGKVTPELKRQIADQVIERMGLTEHQLLVYSHRDTDHPHMHFLVNRVHPGRHVAYDRHQDGKRLTKITMELAREHGLNILRNREYERQLGIEREEKDQPLQTRDTDYWLAKRDGRDIRERFADYEVEHIRSVLYADLHTAKSWEDLSRRLHKRGYTLERKGQGLVLTDGARETKLSNMGKGVRFNVLQERYGETFDNYVAQSAYRMTARKEKQTDRMQQPDTRGMTPGERTTVNDMFRSDETTYSRDHDVVRGADNADMEYRYWTQIEATYRSHQGAVRYAKQREKHLSMQEDRDRAWRAKREQSLMEGLAKVYKDAAKARSLWDDLEAKLGVREAEQAIEKDPFLLGSVRGIRTGNIRTPEREQARRTFKHLMERRQKYREARLRLDHTRAEIERARQKIMQAARDLEMIQKIAGAPPELKKRLMDTVRERARAFERVSERALQRANIADERKAQLERAMRKHQERQREMERERARSRELGFKI